MLHSWARVNFVYPEKENDAINLRLSVPAPLQGNPINTNTIQVLQIYM